ncbi:MAG: alpha/beta fold hydrolase [Nitrospinota bacterium]|nr:alpha/beta fold hydrolase [Nitrospinota bacterium]
MFDVNILKEQYPFKSNYIDLNGLKYHYLDEGQGAPVVMLHGNPTWSFYYRHLVSDLKKQNRVIVPDHMGCGLSDKPQKYNYRLNQHIENLDALLEKLNLKDITFVLHDWGGAIGMGWAVNHPERVKRFVVFNTAAFLLPRIPFRIKICRIPVFGDVAVRVFNAFAGQAIKMATEQKERMTPEVKAGYLAPYNSFANRIAILRFVQDIPMAPEDNSYSLMKTIESRISHFRNHPMLIIWGEKDFCFNDYFLDRWKAYFPDAEVKKVSDAGHYVVEDALEKIVPWVKDFFARNPL